MSDYTITLKKLLDRGFNPFDDTWTTFVPEHKSELCDKIVRAYYFYNIGQETPDKFKYYLNEHLARRMPYWNKLYESALIKIIPEYNHFIEEEGKDVTHNGRNLTKVSRDDISQIKEMASSLQAMINGVLGTHSVTGMVGTDKWKEDTTGDKDGTYTETLNTDVTGKKDSTTKDAFVEKTVTAGEENTTGEENQVGSSTGHKDTQGTQSTNSGGTKRYSETPEGYVSTSGVQIDRNYLTNYTEDSANSATTSSQTEDVTNSDTRDATKTGHKTNSETTDTTSTKDTTYDESTSEDTNTRKNGSTQDEYSEHTTGSRDTASDTDYKNDENTSSNEHRFENGSQRDNISKLGSDAEQETEKRKTDRKITSKGFTISQASLIMEYRKSILDVDAIIIDELGCNFMGVF